MSQRVAKTASFGVVLSLALLHAARAAPPVVQTAEGPVVGRVQGGVRVFTGIPYADAPVGELRFHPPRSHSHWTETLDATREAPACPQTAGSAIGRPSENEDCLYLNVWAPRAGAQQLYPVMVWIHGSGDKGYGGSPYFDGLRLARDNDVVIVTINYRLGLLGSLVSPALDGVHGGQKSGNYHLRDQQEALRWVQRNARAFGGDPRSVTVFGESAGGGAVLALLASPASKDLFQRAIAESPAGAHPLTRLSAERHIREGVLPKLGCADAADLAGCLRAVPVKVFLEEQFGFSYVQDDQLLPMDPFIAFERGAFIHVPVLLGSNAEEGHFHAALFESLRGRRMTTEDYRADIEGLASVPWLRLDPDEALAKYPPGRFPNPAAAESQLVTDIVFACEADLARRALSNYTGVYGYEFAEADPAQEEPLPPVTELHNAPYHTSEEAYVFNGDHDHAPLTGRAARLSELMRAYWTAFARNGDPNGGSRPHWPRFVRDGSRLLSLQDTPRITSDFSVRHNCNRLQSAGLIGVPAR
jgi:para-nitrobenzyl esterase